MIEDLLVRRGGEISVHVPVIGEDRLVFPVGQGEGEAVLERAGQRARRSERVAVPERIVDVRGHHGVPDEQIAGIALPDQHQFAVRRPLQQGAVVEIGVVGECDRIGPRRGRRVIDRVHDFHRRSHRCHVRIVTFGVDKGFVLHPLPDGDHLSLPVKGQGGREFRTRIAFDGRRLRESCAAVVGKMDIRGLERGPGRIEIDVREGGLAVTGRRNRGLGPGIDVIDDGRLGTGDRLGGPGPTADAHGTPDGGGGSGDKLVVRADVQEIPGNGPKSRRLRGKSRRGPGCCRLGPGMDKGVRGIKFLGEEPEVHGDLGRQFRLDSFQVAGFRRKLPRGLVRSVARHLDPELAHLGGEADADTVAQIPLGGIKGKRPVTADDLKVESRPGLDGPFNLCHAVEPLNRASDTAAEVDGPFERGDECDRPHLFLDGPVDPQDQARPFPLQPLARFVLQLPLAPDLAFDLLAGGLKAGLAPDLDTARAIGLGLDPQIGLGGRDAEIAAADEGKQLPGAPEGAKGLLVDLNLHGLRRPVLVQCVGEDPVLALESAEGAQARRPGGQGNHDGVEPLHDRPDALLVDRHNLQAVGLGA